MRKIFVFNWVSLDGFIAGPNGDIEWFYYDDEIAQIAKAAQQRADTIIFGKNTYDVMVAFWPTEASANDDPEVTHYMNTTKKIVFSTTLKESTWENTTILNSIDTKEINQLKSQPGKDMIIYGSGKVIAELASRGLIDEYQLLINPVVLGKGLPEFQLKDQQLRLKLNYTRPLQSGVVFLQYLPA